MNNEWPNHKNYSHDLAKQDIEPSVY